jgi:hypothetical protein
MPQKFYNIGHWSLYNLTFCQNKRNIFIELIWVRLGVLSLARGRGWDNFSLLGQAKLSKDKELLCSQPFIFFVTYGWAQQARFFCVSGKPFQPDVMKH